MNTLTTTLVTEAVYSEEGKKRYLLKKTWDKNLPRLAVIMLVPSEASAVSLDSSSMLTLNNAVRLGYGSVAILNLFATVNDFSLKQAETADPENLEVIVQNCREADAIVYCPGVGKASNKAFQRRQEDVLTALRPMEKKLHCLCNEAGSARHQHPLSPAVRTWYLSPLKVSELLPSSGEVRPAQKKTSRGKGKASTKQE